MLVTKITVKVNAVDVVIARDRFLNLRKLCVPTIQHKTPAVSHTP
ncbi:hypothetical protein [Roseiconus lacunae]|uniref:Uncharacterized protein n=1 Tax=Roseiconus lacunae TaxID=2605694 RepID=A0ABT7PK46_9BACT|nr:hypothetical protein [Roseiconus lacunae]MDM4016859.1 hypothetical protein [Roseiconus lacunae]